MHGPVSPNTQGKLPDRFAPGSAGPAPPGDHADTSTSRGPVLDRVLARALDEFLWLTFVFLVFFLPLLLGIETPWRRFIYRPESDSGVSMTAYAIFNTGGRLLYFAGLEYWKGQTPGKKLFRLRVTGRDGQRAGIVALFCRAVLNIPLSYPPLALIALVPMLARPNGRRITDDLTGTGVIRVKTASMDVETVGAEIFIAGSPRLD